MSQSATGRPPGPARAFVDLFEQERRSGSVIGSRGTGGVRRLGVDRERVLSVDHGALRIQPLNQPGWGRSVLAYGPYERQNGLALAVFLLNGLNASQTGPLPDRLPHRIARWARGSGVDPIWKKLLIWSRHGDKRRFFRRLRYWIENQQGSKIQRLDENLAVGWFPQTVPDDPSGAGQGFIVHADGPENGELWANIAGRQQITHSSLQNLQLYYVVMLRERGAAYYAASGPAANGLKAIPSLQPLAIDPFGDESPLYASISQSVLGQIGFRVDSRIYGIAVQALPEVDAWYGTANAADLLTGSGLLQSRNAARGGSWSVPSGAFERFEDGIWGSQEFNLAILHPSLPTGLLHVLLKADDPAGPNGGLVWGFRDLENYTMLGLDGGTLRLELVAGGQTELLAQEDVAGEDITGLNSLQVSDRGTEVYCSLNGRLAFGGPVRDVAADRTGSGGRTGGCGVWNRASPEGTRLSHFEAHPPSIPLPQELDLGTPWCPPEAILRVADDFSGERAPLAGRTTATGGKTWERMLGQGEFLVTGGGAVKVQASKEQPNPGRTAYTLRWDEAACADLQVDITTPGSGRGQGERCRGGLIFWQDPDHYLIVNTWLNDTYRGASISSFFHLNGYEDLYDAVWTNVGNRITWGKRFTLRVAFDGLHYMAYVDGEAVLYRALSDVYSGVRRLRIRHIGLAANWEWGNDTGSIFQRFTARAPLDGAVAAGNSSE